MTEMWLFWGKYPDEQRLAAMIVTATGRLQYQVSSTGYDWFTETPENAAYYRDAWIVNEVTFYLTFY